MFLLRLRRHVFMLLCFAAAFAHQPAYAQQVTFPSDTLAIKTAKSVIPFTVEVATTQEQHEHGLMFRSALPDDHGMIFDFGTPQHVDFWMKNTIISLDMIFIDEHGVITKVVARVVPESTRLISSDSDVRAVLEVSAGTAARYHIVKGNKLLYSIFK